MFNFGDILKGCKNKELNFQKALYEYTYREYYHIAIRYSRSREDADDIFNIAMFKIFQFLTSTDGSFTNYAGFCSKVIRCTAIDQYRANWQGEQSITLTEVLPESYLDNFLDNLEAEEIFSLIQDLPDKERIVFSMYEIDGFSHKEIAQYLQIKENYSKWVLHNSKKILKNKLAKIGIKSTRV